MTIHAIGLTAYVYHVVFALGMHVHVGVMNMHALIRSYATPRVLDLTDNNIQVHIINLILHWNNLDELNEP